MNDTSVGRRVKEITADSAGQESKHLTLGILLSRLRLAFLMKALVAFAHRPAGFALRENVLNLGFAAREIAISRYP